MLHLRCKRCQKRSAHWNQRSTFHDDLAAPSKLHIKVKGMLTLGVRDALAGQVVQNGVSFARAYAAVITPFRCMQPNLAIIGHIEHHKAQAQAAISSVAMQGRLVKHVLAWECARVVSGDHTTPFFQLRTFQSIRQHGRQRNRMGRVRGERVGVVPNQ